MALRLVDGVEYPWQGPILAATIHLGPIWYWLLALFLAITHSWLGSLILVAMLAASQFPLAYLLGKQLQSRRAGMLWAFALLLPSWSTFDGLIALHYELTSAFVLAFLLCAMRFWQQPRRRYLVGTALFFVLAVHAHPTCIGLIWIALPLIMWAAYTRRCTSIDIGIAVLVGLLPMLPYFFWEAQHGFTDFHAAMGYLGNGDKTGSLARLLPLFWASSLGGTRYWLSAMLGLPDPFASACIIAIAGCGALGLSGIAVGICKKNQRPKMLALLFSMLVILLTTTLIRGASPFYMTTPVHVVLAGLVALGLDRIGESIFARGVRAFTGAVCVAMFGACAICFAQFQINGNWPFNFFPLYNVTAAAGTTNSLLLMPAYAMGESGRFLCAQPSASVHGALARQLLYDYAIGMRLSCGRSDVWIGGNDSARMHWLGLSRAMLAAVHVEPNRYIGPMGVLRARPVSDEPALTEPTTPVYPSYAAKTIALTHNQLGIALRRGEHIAISNMAYFVPDPQLIVKVDGREVEPEASDTVTKVYSCATCSDTHATQTTIEIESTDLRDIDIVVF